MADNPFRQPSTLPYRLPPFDRIKDSDYLPAFEAGMREHSEEVAAIARNPHPSDDDIDKIPNICRCGTYPRIRRAIHRAAEAMREGKK